MAPIRKPLAAWPRRLLDWLCAGRADYRAFQERKRTRVYRANQTFCLLIWAAAAVLLALVCGSAGCLLTIGLIATLLCFAMLDPD
ncbi:MAG: hypothetical protein WBG92_25735 [Thiohalocapsa sp.]